MTGAKRSTPLPLEQTLELSAATSELRRVSAWLYDQLGDGIPKEALLALDLGLQECLANTIIHGSPTAAIRVSLRRFEDRVEIEVEDDGMPFDPLGAVLPPLPTQLEDMELGGNGIRLMRRFLDEMSYRYSSGRNHLVMVRRTGARTEE